MSIIFGCILYFIYLCIICSLFIESNAFEKSTVSLKTVEESAAFGKNLLVQTKVSSIYDPYVGEFLLEDTCPGPLGLWGRVASYSRVSNSDHLRLAATSQ